MDNKQCNCNKTKLVNDLLKRISNLEFEVENLEKYKARNEKAREYIQSTYVTDNPIKFKNTLYEILIGSDKKMIYKNIAEYEESDSALAKQTILDLHKENERLNNIINELEKWLEEDLKQVYRDAGYRHNLILEVLNKLQELKGSDK